LAEAVERAARRAEGEHRRGHLERWVKDRRREAGCAAPCDSVRGDPTGIECTGDQVE